MGKNLTSHIIDNGHQSILEAGCGEGNLVRSRHFPKEVPIKAGVEIFPTYARTANQHGVYDLTVLGDVRSLPFKGKSFNCVVCIEVIEHMPKDQGYDLIGELERITKRQLIISTTDLPLGDVDPEKAADGNIAMYHLARWKPDDFRQRGFNVYGMYPRFTQSSPYDPVYFLSYLLPMIWLVKYFTRWAKT